MDRSRRVTVLGGHYLIAWGVVVELALVVTWLAASGQAVMNPLWAWAGAVLLLQIVPGTVLHRQRRQLLLAGS